MDSMVGLVRYQPAGTRALRTEVLTERKGIGKGHKHRACTADGEH